MATQYRDPAPALPLRTMRAHRLSGVAPYILAALGAVTTGAAVALLPDPYPWILVAVPIAGIMILAGRRVLPRRPDLVASAPPVYPAERALSHTRLIPRMVYFLGAGTMGLLIVRPYAHTTISDAAFAVALLLALAAALASPRPLPRLPKGVVLGAALFAGGAIASSVGASSPSGSLAATARFLYLTLAWFWLGTVVLTSADHVRTATFFWVLSAAIAGLAAIGQVAGVFPLGASQYGRYSGLAGHVNDLGGLTAIAFVPAVMLASTRSRRRLYRLVAFVCVGTIGAGVVLSGSFGAIGAAASALLLWLVSSRRFSQTLAVAVVLASATIVLAHPTSNHVVSPQQRLAEVLGTAGTPQQGTLSDRQQGVAEAWHSIEKSPLTGVGLSPTGARTANGYQVHDFLLKPFYEGGVLAAAGMLIILVTIAVTAIRVVRAARDRAEFTLAIGLLCGYVAFIVFGIVAPVLYQRFGWMPAALILALAAVQRARVPDGGAATRQATLSRATTARKPNYTPA